MAKKKMPKPWGGKETKAEEKAEDKKKAKKGKGKK